MEEFLQSIGITKKGTVSDDDAYVIDLDNYDEYGEIYLKLEKAKNEDKLDELEDATLINDSATNVTYAHYNDKDEIDYEIHLTADLDQNISKISVYKF